MSNVFLGNNAGSLTEAPEFGGYSKVIINIDDETSIEVGDDAARTLEIDCPWGTEEMANNILQGLSGYSYQPYEASGGILNPAAELGDGVTVHGVYGGIYTRETYFDDLHSSDVSAPADEEVDHEYTYEPQEERKVKRQFENVKSQLTVQAGEIAARVTRTGGNNASFGWSLTEDGFILSSGSRNVFECNSSGIIVHGRIEAESGYIGSTSGFNISSRAIWNGVTGMSDTAHNGIYLGTDGIVLGKGAFKVDSAGNLTAKNGTFEGNVYAGNIRAGTGPNGVNYGTFDGGGLSDGSIGGSKYKDGSISKSKLNGAIKAWLKSEGIDVEATKDWVSSISSGNGRINVGDGQLYLAGRSCFLRTKTINGETVRYIGW